MGGIVLASASPRRQELLRRVGLTDFRVMATAADESWDPAMGPEEVVGAISRRKARAALAAAAPGDLIITADTMVFLGEERLGKPRDEAEAPSDAPCPNLPDTVDPCTVEPCTVNSPQQNKDKQNKDKQTPLSPKGGRRRAEPDWGLFEAFWAAYPRKTHKDRARRAWRKLSPTPELCQTMAAALERDKHSRQWTKDNGEYIPYPASWLNAKPWEDDPPPPSPGPGQPLRGEGVRYL